MYFKVQKFTSQNLLNQSAVFCVRNALKVIYEHLKFENFFPGVLPQIPLKGVGRTWGGKQWRSQGFDPGGRKNFLGVPER
jgi:hypothetical protein